MLGAIAPERLAAEGEALRRPPIITTLYDLIAALSAASEPGEEELVTAAVASLCHAGRLRFLAVPHGEHGDAGGNQQNQIE